MQLIDTHTHLYEAQFNEDRNCMIQRALEQQVQKMIIPNVDSTTIQPMLDLVQQYPNNIFAMMGLHPCYVKPETYKTELASVEKISFNQKRNMLL